MAAPKAEQGYCKFCNKLIGQGTKHMCLYNVYRESNKIVWQLKCLDCYKKGL